MFKRTHWSRRPEIIKVDQEALASVVLAFQQGESGFHRLQQQPVWRPILKAWLVDKLAEEKFQGIHGRDFETAKFFAKNWRGFQAA